MAGRSYSLVALNPSRRRVVHCAAWLPPCDAGAARVPHEPENGFSYQERLTAEVGIGPLTFESAPTGRGPNSLASQLSSGNRHGPQRAHWKGYPILVNRWLPGQLPTPAHGANRVRALTDRFRTSFAGKPQPRAGQRDYCPRCPDARARGAR